jgi:hypothetical protein
MIVKRVLPTVFLLLCLLTGGYLLMPRRDYAQTEFKVHYGWGDELWLANNYLAGGTSHLEGGTSSEAQIQKAFFVNGGNQGYYVTLNRYDDYYRMETYDPKTRKRTFLSYDMQASGDISGLVNDPKNFIDLEINSRGMGFGARLNLVGGHTLVSKVPKDTALYDGNHIRYFRLRIVKPGVYFYSIYSFSAGRILIYGFFKPDTDIPQFIDEILKNPDNYSFVDYYIIATDPHKNAIPLSYYTMSNEEIKQLYNELNKN